MNTTIIYKFTDEDAPEDVIAAVRAPELQRAISAYAGWLRQNDKYGPGTPVDFAEIREHFRVFMVERGVIELID